jgi:hypothetical protein
LACLGAIAAASAGGAALVARAQLYTPAQAWKWPVVALLNGVTGLTAVLNAALVAAGGSGGGGASSRAIVALPLACAAATLATLLVSWWRSLQMPVASAKPAPAPASLARAAAAAALLAQWWRRRRAALLPRESAAARAQWRRWVDSDGDCFWHQPSSGASAWEVPRGGDTACGWRWVGSGSGSGGTWMHGPSQCVSEVPPPRSEASAAALIERHERAAAAAAAAQVALSVQREPEDAQAPQLSEAQREAQRREALLRLSAGQQGGRWGRERAGALFGVLAELGGGGAGAAGAAEGGGGSGSAGGGAGGGAEARALVGHLVERSLRHDEQQQARQQARQGRHFASGWAPRE